MVLALLMGSGAAAIAAIDFDLAKLPPPSLCKGRSDASVNEIVVCAARNTMPDMRYDGKREEPLFPVAETGVFGQVRVKAAGEQGNVGGIRTNRAMITFKVPF